MESQPQNPEFRNNPENFHPCILLHLLPNIVCVSNDGSGETVWMQRLV